MVGRARLPQRRRLGQRGGLRGLRRAATGTRDRYTPDSVRFGGRYAGPAGVGEFFSRLPQNFAELRVEPERFLDAGDTVVVQGMHRGRTTADVAFEVPWVHVWTFRGGAITSFTGYFDTARMNAALNPDQARVEGQAAVGSSA